MFITGLNAVVRNPLRYREVGGGGALVDPLPADDGTALAAGLHYDMDANQFVFNWLTSSAFAGKSIELILDLNDGTQKSALFKFTR